jgi:hypothetical protein
MGYTSEAQQKPSARAKKKHKNIRKLYTYKALHQRTIKQYIIIGESKFYLWYQHKKKNFPFNLNWTELQFFYFCCDNGSPDGRDVQAGMTDRMVYQRHVGGFLVFPENKSILLQKSLEINFLHAFEKLRYHVT